ncbi:MAG: GntR family transcriptional regulator [Acidobacteriota bacterium]
MKEQGTSQMSRATLALREMLVQGRFKPGERLREMPLAKQLGISRIPLRLALERLAHEGFLEVRATRGFFAQEFSVGDIHDAIELRGCLEGSAARLAAERLEDRAEAATLRSLHQEMSTLVRKRRFTLEHLGQYVDLNARFHSEIARLAGSRLLRRAMDQVLSLPFASPNAFLQRQFVAPEASDLFLISVDQHGGIVESIECREGARAENLAREHARIARRNLDGALNTLEAVKVVPGLRLIRL